MRSHFNHYLELTKPRIGLLVIITAYLGYYLGLRSIESYMVNFNEWIRLLHLLFGMFLSCSGACVFNQYVESSIDAKMDRTKSRPLPLNKIKPSNAYMFGMFLFLFSTLYLYFFVNPKTAILSCITYIVYVFIYTPLKKYTTLIMVSGSYNQLGKGEVKKIKKWVEEGNTLITIARGSSWAISKKLINESLVESKKDSTYSRKNYVDAREHIGRERIGGVILRADIDLTHPVAFGYNDT